MGTEWQKFELDLSDYGDAEREAIAIEVIDRIVKRTKGGKDKNGRPFAPYSQEYRHSLAFKNAGKSETPDLTLSGDMLDSIQLLSNSDGKVEIGFEDGNIRGTFGHSSPVGPKRDFLGISSKELSSILKKYPLDERTGHRALQVLTTRDAAVTLTGTITFDDLGD